jgi:hypothetical protein
MPDLAAQRLMDQKSGAQRRMAPGPALLGQDPPRDTLPIACDKAPPMPNARRRTREQRTKR